ncbi:hypothetical protein IAQ61_000449 [Plenodomus lingam]|uniref:uncharacterized protein n=1 Tax=Leptosphaeria maculans TaxID=5022 RepID=UPI003317A897|nr:hypothetical protein IAQ61_000449 [Plenodomus lingam]
MRNSVTERPPIPQNRAIGTGKLDRIQRVGSARSRTKVIHTGPRVHSSPSFHQGPEARETAVAQTQSAIMY